MELEPDATQPPPPGPPALGLRDRPLRVAGIVLACSTPITGFLSYAVGAILFGESRFEDSDGLTAAGLAALGLPLFLGALLVLWSFLTPRAPGRRTIAMASAAIGVALLGIGAWSISTADGDASIGGGLLVLASVPLLVVALLALGAQCRSRTS